MSYKQDTKFFKERTGNTITCNCGHRVAMPSYINKLICTWCGHTIYKNKKEEFIDKTIQSIKRSNIKDKKVMI